MKGKQYGLERLFSVSNAFTLISLLLFLLPLMYVEGHISYTSLRYFFFGTIALILGIATAWTWIRAPFIPNTLFKNWYVYGLGAYFGAFLLVSAMSIDKSTSFFSTFQRTDGFFAILFLTIFALSTHTLVVIRGKRALYALLAASVWGALIVSLLVVLSPDGIGTWFAQGRGGATIGNSSVAATYVLFNIFFALLLFIHSAKKQSKLWWSIAIFVLLASPLFLNWQMILGNEPYLGFTSLVGSARGAVLGIIYGAIVAGGSWLVFHKNKLKRSIGIGALSLVFIGTMFAGIQLLDTSSVLHQKFSEVASETRYIFWDIAMKGFEERPVVGWGPGTFDTTYHMFFNPRMLLLPNGGEMWVDRTHNIFFETLVNGGIVLFIALLFFLLSIVSSTVTAVRRGAISSITGSLIIGVLFGWLLQAQFVFESILSYAMLFLIAGIVYALVTKDSGIKYYSPTVSNFGKALYGIIIAASIAAFLCIITLPFKKDRVMTRTYNANLPARATMWKDLADITPMGDGHDSALMFNKISTAYNVGADKLKNEEPKLRQAVLDELDAISELISITVKKRKNDYGQHLIGEQMNYYRMKIANEFSGTPLARARQLGKRALELSPTDPQAYWVLAQLESATGNYTEAKKLLEQAVIQEPRLVTTHNFILQLALNMKDKTYYEESFERATSYIPGYKFNTL